MTTYRYQAELRNVQHGYVLDQVAVTVEARDAESARLAGTESLPTVIYPNMWNLRLTSVDATATVVEQPESDSPATTEVTTG